MHGVIFIVLCAECFDCMLRDLEIVILLYNQFENKNSITVELKNCHDSLVVEKIHGVIFLVF